MEITAGGLREVRGADLPVMKAAAEVVKTRYKKRMTKDEVRMTEEMFVRKVFMLPSERRE